MRYKRVDAAGRCRNNMNGWMVPMAPNRRRRQDRFFPPLQIHPGDREYDLARLHDRKAGRSDVCGQHSDLCRRSAGASSLRSCELYRFHVVPHDGRRLLEYVREVDNDRDLYQEDAGRAVLSATIRCPIMRATKPSPGSSGEFSKPPWRGGKRRCHPRRASRQRCEGKGIRLGNIQHDCKHLGSLPLAAKGRSAGNDKVAISRSGYRSS